MAKIPFFSRLFGGSPQNTEPESSAVPMEQVGQAPAPAPQPDPVLRLQPDHALNKLWELHREQAGAGPPPSLRLWEPGEDPLPPAQEKQERLRLQVAVNSSANRRLTQAKPKKAEEPPPALAAQAAVFVSASQLMAWVLVYPPVGEGEQLSQAMLKKALLDAGVCYGVDEALLDRLPQAPDRYFRLFLAARGTAPVHGKDGYVVDLFPRAIERKFVADDYGRLDYSSLNLVQNVAQGDVICRIIPPVPGTPGRTVLDKELPAKEGRKASAPGGRNTQLSEDGATLVATQSGHVEFTGRGFQVKPVMEIGGNVDYSVGNINFVGDVHIHGDVLSGFSVRAMGSVTVDGVVEACSIEAGGDVTVVKGIVGNEQAVIRAQRSVFTKYLESSCVYARDSLQADCIINCDIYTNGTVQVRTGRGTVIGGRIWAAQEVSAGIVGTQSESPTAICLGGLPCEEFERDLLVREISKYEGELAKLQAQPDSAIKLSMLSKARVKLTISKNKLEQVDQDLNELRGSPEEFKGGRLSCDIAYGGTEVTIDGVTQRLRQAVRPCNVTLSEGALVFN